jgi:hypothetical protein
VAISLKTAGSWARMVTDNGTVAIPGSPAAGDRMFLFGTWKTYTITVADPSGWTPIGTEFANGTTAAGNGTGSVKVMAWYRDWVSGDAAPAIDYSAAPTEGHWVIMLWQKAGGDTWGTPSTATGAIASADPFTVDASTTLTIPDASVVMGLIGLQDDETAIARATDAIDDTGALVTWNGNYVESPATHFNSTTGLDMAGDLGHRLVTTGAAGVTLHMDGDPTAAESGSAKWVLQGLSVPVTGTGAVDLDAPAVTAAAKESFVASGALTLAAPAVAATAKETFVGSGGVDLNAPTVAASGDVTSTGVTGTGAISITAPAVAAAGLERFAGTGALTLAAPAVSATGKESVTGTGAASIDAPAVAATGVLVLTGSGAFAIAAPGINSSGKLTISATGGVSLDAPALAATGSSLILGSGAVSIDAPAVSAAGIEQIIGAGGIDIDAPGVSGSNLQGVAGTGALDVDAPSVVASGTLRIQGSSDLLVAAPDVAGLGDLLISGAGAISFIGPMVDGDGTHPIIGVGAMTIAAPLIIGSAPIVVSPLPSLSHGLAGFRKVRSERSDGY